MYAHSIRMTAAAGDGSDSGGRVHNSSFNSILYIHKHDDVAWIAVY